MAGWGNSVTDDQRLVQFKLVYDYIKFHIGLYLATPTLLAIVAKALDVEAEAAFRYGFYGMIAIYALAGVHATWFMSTYVNMPWQDDFLTVLEGGAFAPSRRIIHHALYWAGLVAGLAGLFAADLLKH